MLYRRKASFLFFAPTSDLDGAVCPTLPESRKRLFFGKGNAAKAAAAICEACPVAAACLEIAREFEQDLPLDHWAGVYGGLSAAERIRLFGKAAEEEAA